jgi:hypothetical protein
MSVTDCELLTELIEEEMAITINVSNSGNNSNSSCGCCGGGGGGNNPITNVPWVPSLPGQGGQEEYDTLPPPGTGIDDGINPPPGFDTYEDYLAYKCQAATKLVDDLLETLNNLQTFGGMVGLLGPILAATLMNGTTLGPLFAGIIGTGVAATFAWGLMIAAFLALLGLGVVAAGFT